MEYGNVIAILIGILWFVLPLVLRAMRARRGEPQPELPTPVVDFQNLVQVIERARDLNNDLENEIHRLSKQVNSTIGPVRILSEVLDQLSEEQAQIRSELETSFQDIENHCIPMSLSETLGLLEWQRLRVAAVTHMFDVRSDRVAGEMMADADALAAANLKPLVQFAQIRDIDFPKNRPICVPAMPGQEAVFFGLLPEGYPTVFVPSDFGKDLLRWPAVSHEIGHVIWREWPGFADELRQSLKLDVDATIPTGPKAFDLRRCYSAWLEELFCDYFTVLKLGPPALRGMLSMFSPPNIPVEQLVWATARQDQYEEHPPPQLRIQLAAHSLIMMGYDLEAKQLMRQWSAKVGTPSMYGFPALITPPFGIPTEKIESFGRKVVTMMHELQLRSLAGFPLPSIPGLAMTPGVWARVAKEKEALLKGQGRSKDPRVIISAAIEARADSSRSSSALARAVTRAIVGIDELREPVPERESIVPESQGDELLEGMILYQVLSRDSRGGIVRKVADKRSSRMRL